MEPVVLGSRAGTEADVLQRPGVDEIDDEPKRWHRQSIRLRGYDYCTPGACFITMSIHERRPLLGIIRSNTVMLSPIGEMVAAHWLALPERFPAMALDASVVMPDHMHGIIVLRDGMPAPQPALGDIIGAFKSLTTHAYILGVREQGWPRFNKRFWQRDYYERIVRDDRALRSIRSYIGRNPQCWRKGGSSGC